MPDATKPADTKQPDWSTRPTDWAHWYIETNPAIYRTFRSMVRARLVRYPRARLSADAVLHAVRWNTPINARGDLFKINDHASALFARLYVFEYPEAIANFELRKSLFDNLEAHEMRQLLLAAHLEA